MSGYEVMRHIDRGATAYTMTEKDMEALNEFKKLREKPVR